MAFVVGAMRTGFFVQPVPVWMVLVPPGSNTLGFSLAALPCLFQHPLAFVARVQGLEVGQLFGSVGDGLGKGSKGILGCLWRPGE